MKCRVSQEESKNFHNQKDAIEFSYQDKRFAAREILIAEMDKDIFAVVEFLSKDMKHYDELKGLLSDAAQMRESFMGTLETLAIDKYSDEIQEKLEGEV